MATGTAGNSQREYHTAQTHYLRKKLTWDNPGVNTALTLGVIPPRASVVGGGVHILTAFNSTSTDTVNVGFSAGSSTLANALGSALGAEAVGLIVLDELASTGNVCSTAAQTVTCTYVSTSTGASAGEAVVSVLYTVPVVSE